MALHHNPRTITSGLKMMLDIGDKNSYPTRGIATTWTDYQSHQADYTVLGTDGVYIKNTYTSWIGYFPATVIATGEYTIMFDYVGDASAVLILDNDGIVDNQYNASINVTTGLQTFKKTVTINTTGDIRHYLARSSGGNITVTNFRFFKSDKIYDIVSGTYTGTIVNTPMYSLANGGVLTFDGTNDYMQIPDGLDTETATNSTYEFWCKTTTNKNAEYLKVGSGAVTNSAGEMAFFYINNLMYFIKFVSGAGDRPHIKARYNYNLADGEWKHIVGTYQGTTTAGTSRLYYNGAEVNSYSTVEYSTSEAQPGFSQATSYAFAGDLANIKVYNRALSATEIEQNYNASKGRFGL